MRSMACERGDGALEVCVVERWCDDFTVEYDFAWMVDRIDLADHNINDC